MAAFAATMLAKVHHIAKGRKIYTPKSIHYIQNYSCITKYMHL